jgi:2,4-didehydro-3-deoxy-L-rhamnonate hydrolase
MSIGSFAGPFALGTLSSDDTPFPALVRSDGQALDLRRALGDPRLTLSGLLESGALPTLHAFALDPGAGWRSLAGLRVHAPVEPRQVFQASHPRTAEDLPYVFTGLPTAITGPYDDVVLPAWATLPDWELGLAVVIGRAAYRLGEHEALSAVAGYTIANDLTDRASVFRADLPAIGSDWLRSKNAPGFTPLGPWLVPAPFVPDPGRLHITLTLNGQVMQDESTSDMIVGVARLVSYISQTARLLPGDVVLTGSPASNGAHGEQREEGEQGEQGEHRKRPLADGDVMEGSITGLGSQRTRCVADRA